MQRAARFSLPSIFAILLALSFAPGAARADEYSDVNALLRTGKSAEALAKADAYIATKPRDPQMRFLRSVILTEQGKQAEATQALTQLTQDFPELPEPYNNLAAIYASQGQFDKARAALESAVRVNPNYGTAHENLGDIYARLAAHSYAKARQFEPGNSTAAPKLKQIEELLGDTKARAAAGTLPPAAPSLRKPVR